MILALSLSSRKLTGVLIILRPKKLFYWNHKQFLDAFDFDDRESLFLYATI